MRVAFAEAREQVAQYTITQTTTPGKMRGYRLLFLFDRLLMGNLRADDGAGSKRPVKARLRERLDPFWQGQWHLLLEESRPDRPKAPAEQATDKCQANQNPAFAH